MVSRRRSTSAASERTRTGRFASTAANTIRGSAIPYDNFARYGLSFQRSQVSGRFTAIAGPNVGYYSRMDTQGAARKQSIFDGLPRNYRGGNWRRRKTD